MSHPQLPFMLLIHCLSHLLSEHQMLGAGSAAVAGTGGALQAGLVARLAGTI